MQNLKYFLIVPAFLFLVVALILGRLFYTVPKMVFDDCKYIVQGLKTGNYEQ
jgi:hypothetical protein